MVIFSIICIAIVIAIAWHGWLDQRDHEDEFKKRDGRYWDK